MPESHERSGESSSEHDDDELVTELRALAARLDPVPAAVLAAARDAVGARP